MVRTPQYIAVRRANHAGNPFARFGRDKNAPLTGALGYASYESSTVHLKPLKPILQLLTHVIRNPNLRSQDPRLIGGIAAGVAVVAGGVWWYIAAHRLSSEEIERRRREELALGGRITDGVILDARTLSNEDSVSPSPEVLVYSYSLAGLTYTCAQDVTTLPNEVVGFRLDQSVQVRYDPRNPGNSIIVSETWTGLWIHPKA
ncbi:MAG TPA: DUF3592 domain-containing protein [Acidobacteriaceae bacterium]